MTTSDASAIVGQRRQVRGHAHVEWSRVPEEGQREAGVSWVRDRPLDGLIVTGWTYQECCTEIEHAWGGPHLR
ncbi:hypothetical protein ACFU76_04570 [Streptomyces sp. NPDC057539]|uniref:hypothetical protein n=1 Tax=Streptomyces sp. NPDC057539 TaxID=3346159 RepID=UPI0036C5B042